MQAFHEMGTAVAEVIPKLSPSFLRLLPGGRCMMFVVPVIRQGMESTIDDCSKNHCGTRRQHHVPLQLDVKMQGKKPNEMEEVQKLEGMLEGKV